MDIDYPTDNINNMIRVIRGMEWAGRDLDTMVELGYIITHGDFSDDNLIGKSAPFLCYQFCAIPYRYMSYSLGDILSDKDKDIIHYFRLALEFVTNHIKELWYDILQQLNDEFKIGTWVHKEFIGFMEENKDKYPEQYLEMKLL